MSALRMLKPAEGVQGVKDFVVEQVTRAGGQPLPAHHCGCGGDWGGTMEKASLMAKRAILRPIGSTNPKPHLAELEAELLALVNKTGGWVLRALAERRLP